MSLPVYPSFRSLQLEDKPEFDEAFNLNPPEISEFTFTNLYAWRNFYRFEVTRFGDYLLLAALKEGRRSFFNPIGQGDRKAVIVRILQDTPAPFIRLPESVPLMFTDDPRFRVEPDRDNSDYLFRTLDLIELRGNKYHGKRNLIANFTRAHPDYEYLKLLDEHLEESSNFQTFWCQERGCEEVVSLSAEQEAVREMLAHFRLFNLAGGAIRIDGTMRALALAERLNKETLVLHAFKAAADANGLYQTMQRDFLQHEAGGYAYVNLEQDLGVEGLRRAKQSYHPLRMIAKYTLRPA